MTNITERYNICDAFSSVLLCQNIETGHRLCIKPNCNATSNYLSYTIMEMLDIKLIPFEYCIKSNFELIANNISYKITDPALCTTYYPNTTVPPRMSTYIKQEMFGFNKFCVNDIDDNILKDVNKLLIVDFIFNTADRNNDSFLFTKEGNCVVIDNDSMLGIDYNANVHHAAYTKYTNFLSMFLAFSRVNVFYYEVTKQYGNINNRHKMLTDWLPTIQFLDNLSVSDFDNIKHAEYADQDTFRLFETFMNYNKPKIVESFYNEYNKNQ